MRGMEYMEEQDYPTMERIHKGVNRGLKDTTPTWVRVPTVQEEYRPYMEAGQRLTVVR